MQRMVYGCNSKNIQVWKMDCFGIMKIMDGLFISDLSVPTDLLFISSNKISHIVGWASIDMKLVEEGFHHLRLDKQEQQLPSKQDIVKAVDLLLTASEECTCALIYTTTLPEGSLLAIPYLMARFQWSARTAIRFLQIKIDSLDLQEIIIHYLEEIQTILSQRKGIKFKSLEFTVQALSCYETDDTDEMLLINTVKNTHPKVEIGRKQGRKTGPRKKVQWVEKQRTSAASFSLKKYGFFNRATFSNLSLKKPKKPFMSQKVLKQGNLSMSKDSRSWKENVNGSLKLLASNETDPNIDSLKELSRMHLKVNVKSSGKVKKKGSIKVPKGKKTNPAQHHQSSSCVDIKTLSAKDFLEQLKSMNMYS